MAWDLISGLRLRLMSQAGAVLYQWEPADSVIVMRCGPPKYPKEEQERKTIRGADRSTIRGVRPVLRIELLTEFGHFDGAGLLDDLEVLIEASVSTAGSYFELTTDYGSPPFAPAYKRVKLANDWAPEAWEGKDLGQRVVLEFEAADLQLNVPATDNGATW